MLIVSGAFSGSLNLCTPTLFRTARGPITVGGWDDFSSVAASGVAADPLHDALWSIWVNWTTEREHKNDQTCPSNFKRGDLYNSQVSVIDLFSIKCSPFPPFPAPSHFPAISHWGPAPTFRACTSSDSPSGFTPSSAAKRLSTRRALGLSWCGNRTPPEDLLDAKKGWDMNLG